MLACMYCLPAPKLRGCNAVYEKRRSLGPQRARKRGIGDCYALQWQWPCCCHVWGTYEVPAHRAHSVNILPFLLPPALHSPLRVHSLQSWSADTPCARGLPCAARWRRVGGSGALPRPESHFVAHGRMCRPPAVYAHLEPGRLRHSYARISWLMPCTRETRRG